MFANRKSPIFLTRKCHNPKKSRFCQLGGVSKRRSRGSDFCERNQRGPTDDWVVFKIEKGIIKELLSLKKSNDISEHQ